MGSIVAEIAEKLSSTAGSFAIDGTLSLKEQADAESDVAGEGQIWVNTATPNELWFTDDSGKDQKVVVGRGVYNSLTHASIAFGI